MGARLRPGTHAMPADFFQDWNPPYQKVATVIASIAPVMAGQ